MQHQSLDLTATQNSTYSNLPRLVDVLRERGLLALTGLGLFFFLRPLLFGDVFYFRDLYLYYLPRKRLLADLLSRGELPLWNPFLHGGSPFLADVNPGTLYPTNFLYFFFEPYRAMTLETVFHLLLAAGAVYALARVLRMSPSAAMLAGGLYAYCGVSLSGANLYGRLLAAPHLPLMVLAWHLLLHDGRRRWAAMALLTGVLQVLAGAPEMIACAMVTLFIWTLAVSTGRFSLRQRLGGWLLLGTTIGALSAVQLVPLIELVQQSQRGEGMSFADFARWSVPLRRIPEFLIAGFFGPVDTLLDLDYWGIRQVDGGFPYFLSLYFGGMTFALALLGGYRGLHLKRLRIALVVLAGGSLLLSLGRFLPGFELLYEGIPPLRIFRYPVKFLTLTMLPMALLAAAGLDVATKAAALDFSARRTTRRVMLSFGLLFGLPTLGLLIVLHMPDRSSQILQWFFRLATDDMIAGVSRTLMQTLGIWFVAGALLFLPRLRGHAAQGTLLAVLLIGDLMLAGRSALPTAPRDLFTSTPQAVEKVREVLGDGRLYRLPNPDDLPIRFAARAPSNDIYWLYRWNQEMLAFYLGSTWDLPVIFHRDFNGLANERIVNLSRALEKLPWERRIPFLSAASVRGILTHEELDLPDVEKVETLDNASGVPFFLYDVRRAAPRATLIRLWVHAKSGEKALEALFAPGFDPRRHAVIETGDLEDASLLRPQPGCEDSGNEGSGEIETQIISSRERHFTVRSRCPALLVLSDPFYRGWTASVDGESVKIFHANYAYSALELEAGEHEIVWKYAPASVRLGTGISFLSLILLALAFRRFGKTSQRPL